MVLKEDNFACVKINWNDKVVNMKEISEELNIGLDSMVFIDDDPVNIEYVRTNLPELASIQMPSDNCHNNSRHLQSISSLFNVLKITDEDKARNKMYLEQSQELIKSINFGVMQSNVNEILEGCHQLKSISKTIGAHRVAELAVVFEEQCKTDELNSDKLIDLRDQLEIEYSKAAQFLKEQIKSAEQQEQPS